MHVSIIQQEQQLTKHSGAEVIVEVEHEALKQPCHDIPLFIPPERLVHEAFPGGFCEFDHDII